MIYLDNAATASYNEVDDIIIDTMVKAMKRYWQNPSSLYASDVKKEIDECRVNITEHINAEPKEVYFTSGASESNNWAIRGRVDWISCNLGNLTSIITTKIEHKSILEAVSNPCLDARIYYCNVDKYGVINLNSLKEKLEVCQKSKEPILVSISIANNEIGVIQPIKNVADLVHKYGGVLHVDATQAIPYIPVNVKELGIDMMSASGHKISPALRGIGFLYKKNGIDIQPLIYGAQENGLRAGTENTYGIIGLNKAIEYCDTCANKQLDMCCRRDYFIKQLKNRFGCTLNGHNKHRLPNNINVTFPQNISGESLLYTLDLADIKCSVGSACNSHTNVPSYVLKAIGLTDEEAMKTVRFTLPDDITYDDINNVIEEISKCIKIITS